MLDRQLLIYRNVVYFARELCPPPGLDFQVDLVKSSVFLDIRNNDAGISIFFNTYLELCVDVSVKVHNYIQLLSNKPILGSVSQGSNSSVSVF